MILGINREAALENITVLSQEQLEEEVHTITNFEVEERVVTTLYLQKGNHLCGFDLKGKLGFWL